MAHSDMVRVRALHAFTKTTEFGNFHGDPNSHLEEGREPLVPASVLDELLDRGCVELLTGERDMGGASTPPRLPQLDHDGDGEPGGSKPHDPPALSGKTRKELFAIAKAEGVKVDAKWKNDLIVAAIEAAREGADDDADGPPA